MAQLKLTCALLLLAASASAGPIVFDLRGGVGSAGQQLDGQGSGAMVTIGGLSAIVLHNGGVFNQNVGAFGINAPAAGDATDQIDSGSGLAESLSVIFDQDVTFASLGASLIGGSDFFDLTVAGVLDNSTNKTEVLGGLYVSPLLGTLIAAGLSIDITHVAGNGFSLDSIAVDLPNVPVPEPETFGLVALGLGAGGLLRWRRHALGRCSV
jgi:hypothetical protein